MFSELWLTPTYTQLSFECDLCKEGLCGFVKMGEATCSYIILHLKLFSYYLWHFFSSCCISQHTIITLTSPPPHTHNAIWIMCILVREWERGKEGEREIGRGRDRPTDWGRQRGVHHFRSKIVFKEGEH